MKGIRAWMLAAMTLFVASCFPSFEGAACRRDGDCLQAEYCDVPRGICERGQRVDGGTPVQAGGAGGEDGGVVSFDAGTPGGEDGGAISTGDAGSGGSGENEDAGDPTTDAGAEVDGGSPQSDGGSAQADGGSSQPDGGSSQSDGGMPDSGVSGADGGTDAGAPVLGIGQSCNAPGDCASTYCVDGVCCESACTGQCERCNSKGACKPVTEGGAPVVPRTACGGFGACGPACDGIHGASCTFPDADAGCGGPTCLNGSELAFFCDGAGSCQMKEVRNCDPSKCNGAGTACATSCSGDGDCAPDAWCDGGACDHDLDFGRACSSNGQCMAGMCVDGICCRSQCNGACEACVVGSDPMNAGQCVPVAGGTQDYACGNYVCTGNQSCYAGDCASNAECSSTAYCTATSSVMNQCVMRKLLGQSCTVQDECLSGNCVNNTCCDSACSGPCQSCSNTGGHCSNVDAGTVVSALCANACNASGECPCNMDSDCYAGMTCVGNVCAHVCVPDNPCLGDTECYGGQCKSHVCKC